MNFTDMQHSQTARLYHVLKDYQPHSTLEILRRVYGNSHSGIARISARVWDLQHDDALVKIISFRDPKRRGIWYYQLQK